MVIWPLNALHRSRRINSGVGSEFIVEIDFRFKFLTHTLTLSCTARLDLRFPVHDLVCCVDALQFAFLHHLVIFCACPIVKTAYSRSIYFIYSTARSFDSRSLQNITFQKTVEYFGFYPSVLCRLEWVFQMVFSYVVWSRYFMASTKLVW